MTAAVALTLLGGTVVSTYFAVEAEGNARHALAALEDTKREKRRADQKAEEALREKQRADRKADEARTAQTRAEENAHRAQQQKELARRNLYAAEMKLAQNAYRDTRIGRVLELLERQRPQASQEDIRGFEWYYLLGLCQTDLVTLDGHTAPVTCVAFSPDGKILASGSGDSLEQSPPGEVKLWDRKTSQLRATLRGHRDTITSLAFSTDGRVLATVAGREAARLWDVRTGKQRAILGNPAGPGGKVCVAFSPEGATVATGGTKGVDLWDVSSGRKRASFRSQDDVRSLAFSPDGKTLATCSGNGIKLWDVTTGEVRNSLVGDPGPDQIMSLAVSPDGQTLASAAMGGTVTLWDVASGRERANFQGYKETRGDPMTFGPVVVSLVFSPDGKTLATGAGGAGTGTVMLWDVVTGKKRHTLVEHGSVLNICLAFSPDGQTLATGTLRDKTAKLWDVVTGQERDTYIGHAGSVTCMVFSPDGRTLAVGGGVPTEHGEVKLWAVHPRQSTFKGSGTVAFSPADNSLATGSGRAVKIWDLTTGQQRASLGEHTKPVKTVAFSPDGTVLASVAGDIGAKEPGELKLWDLSTRQDTDLKGHNWSVSAVAFSPDGKTLASVGGPPLPSKDGEVILWDVTTGVQRATYKGDKGWVKAVEFSPDGRTLATVGSGSVKLWDVTTGRVRITLPVKPSADSLHTHLANCLAFSPDGKTLATGGSPLNRVWSDVGELKLWEVSSGMERTSWTETGMVRCIAFSPDGKTLASGSSGNTVKLWDPLTGQERLILGAKTDDGTISVGVTFSSDGKWLASASRFSTGDGVKVWDARSVTPELRIERQALSLVRSLFGYKKLPKSEVLKHIRTDQTITELVRQEALTFAAQW